MILNVLKVFQNFKSTFEELVWLVGPHIQKKDTNFRRAVCPQERLLITQVSETKFFTTFDYDSTIVKYKT